MQAESTNPSPSPADEADVAVIYIGVNDVWWRKTTPEVFERGLREIVDQAKANKTIPVLATLAVMKKAIGSRNSKCDGNLLTHDGVHMNGRGNEIVANLIANGICEALRKN